MVDLSNGLPIYVSEYNSLDTTDNEKLCSEIKNMPELDSRFLMIIVNKADDANLKSFNEERLLHQAIPRQLYSGGVWKNEHEIKLNIEDMTSEELLKSVRGKFNAGLSTIQNNLYTIETEASIIYSF